MAVAFAGLAGYRNLGTSSRHATDWGRFDGACGVLPGLLATKAVLDRGVANPGKAGETSPLLIGPPTKKAHPISRAHRQFSIRWKLID
jgi:hypothetical protein